MSLVRASPCAAVRPRDFRTEYRVRADHEHPGRQGRIATPINRTVREDEIAIRRAHLSDRLQMLLFHVVPSQRWQRPRRPAAVRARVVDQGVARDMVRAAPADGADMSPCVPRVALRARKHRRSVRPSSPPQLGLVKALMPDAQRDDCDTTCGRSGEVRSNIPGQ